MSQDFRQQLSYEWRRQRLQEALVAYRDAVDTAWYDFWRELRPPCRICDNWPCTCRK